MVKFIFEDNPDMVTSQLLLTHLYNKDNILFSGSSSRLAKTLKRYYNNDDTFIIYYDLVLENKEVVKGYYTLCNKIRKLEKYNNNVYVIPIFCFEYILLTMLVRSEYIEDSELNTKATINFDYNFLKRTYPSSKSLEHIYKHILETLDSKFQNYNIKDKMKTGETLGDLGSFYRFDELDKKAELLYLTYPLADINTEGHKEKLSQLGIVYIMTPIATILDDINNTYKQLYTALGKQGDFKKFLFRVKRIESRANRNVSV